MKRRTVRIFDMLKALPKYLVFYVIPVFLGALFALMVTNWQHARSEKKAERNLLRKIQSELMASDSLVQADYAKQEQLLEYSKRLIRHYTNKDYNIHPDTMFFMLTRVLSYYEIQPILIGNGVLDFNLLKDEDLKIQIANYLTIINNGFQYRDIHRAILSDILKDVDVFFAKHAVFDDSNNNVFPRKSKYITKREIKNFFSNDAFFGRVIMKTAFDGNLLEYQNGIIELNQKIRDRIDQAL